MTLLDSQKALDIATRVEAFVRNVVVPYEKDVRIEIHAHGPPDDLVAELRQKAKSAGF